MHSAESLSEERFPIGLVTSFERGSVTVSTTFRLPVVRGYGEACTPNGIVKSISVVRTLSCPSISTTSATGHVREISPQADPTTCTYLVKVGLDGPPDTMRLGATVVGSVTLSAEPVVSVPGTALLEMGGKPVVWVVDPKTGFVAARAVSVVRYESSAVVISSGLKTGDVVVTAGVHALRPGQQVKVASAAPRPGAS